MSRTSTLDVANAAEQQVAKMAHGSLPWIAWLLGVPAATIGFGMAAKAIHSTGMIAGPLAACAGVVAATVWKVSHSRSWVGKAHHALNAAAGLGVIAAVVRYGWLGLHGWVMAVYVVGGLTLTLLWNVRHTPHAASVQDVILPPRRQQRAPAMVGTLVRRALPAAAQVVTGTVVAPDTAAAGKPAGPDPAGASAPAAGPAAAPAAAPAAVPVQVVTGTDEDTARQRATAIAANWIEFAANKARNLGGSQMVIVAVEPWVIRTVVRLKRGEQTPDMVEKARPLIASQNQLPLAAVFVRPNPDRGDEVFVDFKLGNPLKTPRPWPGPLAVGGSIADAPTQIGVYEDGETETLFGPAVTAKVAAALGLPEGNLSHLAVEGMNGAGKSEFARMLIADAATRRHVVTWAIDPVKRTQTFGHVAGGIDWLATTAAEGVAMVRFVALRVIPARAEYLGLQGMDNWEPGCGIPFLRVIVEEAGIISNDLEDLDKVLNSARSVGIQIILSAQRFQHALVSTNVRAALSNAMIFGARDSGDSLAMPDGLADAGADPAQWGNRVPGMHYHADAAHDVGRWIIPARTFRPDKQELRELISRHAPARAGWLEQDCADWFDMLRRIDGSGVWAKRTTGASVLADIEAAEAKRDGVTIPLAPTRAPAAPPPTADPEFVVPDYPPEPDDPEEPVTVSELDLSGELGDDDAAAMTAAVAEDADIDPDEPLPPYPLPPESDFSLRRPGYKMPRDDALALFRGFLMTRPDGWEFSPRDVYDEVCRKTGLSTAWVRTALSTTLMTEGLVSRDDRSGRYLLHRPQARRPV